MKLCHFIERGFVKGAPNEPGFVAVAEKIVLAQVLDPDQSFRRIVKINLRRANAVLGQKLARSARNADFPRARGYT